MSKSLKCQAGLLTRLLLSAPLHIQQIVFYLFMFIWFLPDTRLIQYSDNHTQMCGRDLAYFSRVFKPLSQPRCLAFGALPAVITGMISVVVLDWVTSG